MRRSMRNWRHACMHASLCESLSRSVSFCLSALSVCLSSLSLSLPQTPPPPSHPPGNVLVFAGCMYRVPHASHVLAACAYASSASCPHDTAHRALQSICRCMHMKRCTCRHARSQEEREMPHSTHQASRPDASEPSAFCCSGAQSQRQSGETLQTHGGSLEGVGAGAAGLIRTPASSAQAQSATALSWVLPVCVCVFVRAPVCWCACVRANSHAVCVCARHTRVRVCALALMAPCRRWRGAGCNGSRGFL